jgi:serine/threonine protein kinase
VKQLSQTSHQGKSQFVTEVATISSVQHRNLVKLYGCCIDSNTPLLVYEYHMNGSLDRAFLSALTSAHQQHRSIDINSQGFVFLKVFFLNVQGTVA